MPASELPDGVAKEILNIDEAAAYLGVSSKTFQKVLREGEMPGRKVGREWKFSRRALESWIANSRSRDFLDLEDRESADAPAAVPAPLAVAAVAAAGAGNGTARASAPVAVRPRRAGAGFSEDED